MATTVVETETHGLNGLREWATLPNRKIEQRGAAVNGLHFPDLPDSKYIMILMGMQTAYTSLSGLNLAEFKEFTEDSSYHTAGVDSPQSKHHSSDVSQTACWLLFCNEWLNSIRLSVHFACTSAKIRATPELRPMRKFNITRMEIA